MHYNIERDNLEAEVAAFIKMGGQLGKRRRKALWPAGTQNRHRRQMELKAQQRLPATDKIKTLIISHKENNLTDKFVGEGILKSLEELGAVPVSAA